MKIYKSDNASFLRVKLDMTYKELSTIRDLRDINVKDKDGNTTFTVHNSQSVHMSTNGVAFPMGRANKPITITAQLADGDELETKYFAATVQEGLKEYTKNFNKAKAAIEKLAESVEVE